MPNENELGGLWLRTSQKGTKFMTGKIKGIGDVVVFKNTHKAPGDKKPDYLILKSTPQRERPARQDDNDGF